MDWMKISAALLLGLMLIVLWPRARHMLRESPKGSGEEWRSALFPLLLVVGFVVLLVLSVR